MVADVERPCFDAWDSFHAVFEDPANPELRANLERHHTGPSLEINRVRLDRLVAEDLVVRAMKAPPTQTQVLRAPVRFPDDPTLADMVVCETLASLDVELGAAADGSSTGAHRRSLEAVTS